MSYILVENNLAIISNNYVCDEMDSFRDDSMDRFADSLPSDSPGDNNV